MFKIIYYFIQSFFIYFFFLIGRLFGIRISRKIFGNLFLLVGPIFKSNKIIVKNLEIFSIKNSNINKNKIINEMWRNYGKTFIEYIFLDKFRKESAQISFEGEENLSEISANKKPVIFVSGSPTTSPPTSLAIWSSVNILQASFPDRM